MMKTYKIVLMDNEGAMVAVTLSSPYDLKKWCRMNGYEKAGLNANPRQRAELQGELRFTGLCGPMYDGQNETGGAIIRYECLNANDRLSA